MAKKKNRKAGMVKRQQAKKHSKAVLRKRTAATRRTVSNPQLATQRRLEELLSTLPFLAFTERFADIRFDVETVRQELEAGTPEPLLLMRLLTEEFLAEFRAQFEAFEQETTPQSPDNLLAKATLHQLDHSAEIPHLSNPMIVAVYLKARAEALSEPELSRETIHEALDQYEQRNNDLIERLSENPATLVYGANATLPEDVSTETDDEPTAEAEETPPSIPQTLVDGFLASLDLTEEEKERVEEDLETFLEDFNPPPYQEWTPALIDQFVDEWFVQEANPLAEDLASMRRTLLYFLRYLREQSELPEAFGETRPVSLEGAA